MKKITDSCALVNNYSEINLQFRRRIISKYANFAKVLSINASFDLGSRKKCEYTQKLAENMEFCRR